MQSDGSLLIQLPGLDFTGHFFAFFTRIQVYNLLHWLKKYRCLLEANFIFVNIMIFQESLNLFFPISPCFTVVSEDSINCWKILSILFVQLEYIPRYFV